MLHKIHSNSKGRILEGDIINSPININQIQSNFKYDTKDLPKLMRSPTRNDNSYQLVLTSRSTYRRNIRPIMVKIVPKSNTQEHTRLMNIQYEG